MDLVHLNKLFSISNWWFLIPCYCQNSIGDLWNTLCSNSLWLIEELKRWWKRLGLKPGFIVNQFWTSFKLVLTKTWTAFCKKKLVFDEMALRIEPNHIFGFNLVWFWTLHTPRSNYVVCIALQLLVATIELCMWHISLKEIGNICSVFG